MYELGLLGSALSSNASAVFLMFWWFWTLIIKTNEQPLDVGVGSSSRLSLILQFLGCLYDVSAILNWVDNKDRWMNWVFFWALLYPLMSRLSFWSFHWFWIHLITRRDEQPLNWHHHSKWQKLIVSRCQWDEHKFL